MHAYRPARRPLHFARSGLHLRRVSELRIRKAPTFGTPDPVPTPAPSQRLPKGPQ